ncbi:MAG: PTS sugar transporter subunit IIA [Corynebacterium sp.]|nr:PTS sugar transporter subunit IIA [Corynebacterium sp.]
MRISCAAKRYATDCVAAIRMLGPVFEKAKIVSADFAEALLETAMANSGAVVLMPGLAVLTTDQPSFTTGIAVLTLTDPVEFGHSLNDPVDLIIGVATAEEDSVFRTRARIAGLIGDFQKLESVRNAATDEELICLLEAIKL